MHHLSLSFEFPLLFALFLRELVFCVFNVTTLGTVSVIFTPNLYVQGLSLKSCNAL
jgi:hypothetical protein